MRTYKLCLKINKEISLTEEIDMYKITHNKWIEIREKMRKIIQCRKGGKKTISLVSEIGFKAFDSNQVIKNEIYLTKDVFSEIFGKIVFRMCEDFSMHEKIRCIEEGVPLTTKIRKSLSRVPVRATGKKEFKVSHHSLQPEKHQVSMTRNLEYISKLKAMGDKTKELSLSELANEISFPKTHAGLRYILDLTGIEYRRYR